MLAGHTRRICHSMARWARTTSLSPMSRRLAKRSEFEVSFHKNDQKIIIKSHAILLALAPRTGNANASRIPNRESRDRETARVTYVIQIPHRPPPGRERPCSDHNRPNPFTIGSARPDSHTLPRRSRARARL